MSKKVVTTDKYKWVDDIFKKYNDKLDPTEKISLVRVFQIAKDRYISPEYHYINNKNVKDNELPTLSSLHYIHSYNISDTSSEVADSPDRFKNLYNGRCEYILFTKVRLCSIISIAYGIEKLEYNIPDSSIRIGKSKPICFMDTFGRIYFISSFFDVFGSDKNYVSETVDYCINLFSNIKETYRSKDMNKIFTDLFLAGYSKLSSSNKTVHSVDEYTKITQKMMVDLIGKHVLSDTSSTIRSAFLQNMNTIYKAKILEKNKKQKLLEIQAFRNGFCVGQRLTNALKKAGYAQHNNGNSWIKKINIIPRQFYDMHGVLHDINPDYKPYHIKNLIAHISPTGNISVRAADSIHPNISYGNSCCIGNELSALWKKVFNENFRESDVVDWFLKLEQTLSIVNFGSSFTNITSILERNSTVAPDKLKSMKKTTEYKKWVKLK